MNMIHEDITLGPVRLILGDCLKIAPKLERGSVTLLWTDPPYGHGNHDGDFNDVLNKHRDIESTPIANDGPDEMRAVVDSMLTGFLPALRDDCCCCCCCCGGGPRPTFAWVASRMDEKGLAFFHSVIWDKKNPGLGWRFRRQHEMVMVAHKRGGKLAWPNGDVAVPNVISMIPPRDRVHPNEKPLSLVEKFITWTTSQGDMVLDPFMGSGTTLIAAIRTGRRAIGIEIDSTHYRTAVERVKRELAQPTFTFDPQPQPKQEVLL
jgi:site-specific DNA-methyltransferase (adenine-specific)